MARNRPVTRKATKNNSEAGHGTQYQQDNKSPGHWQGRIVAGKHTIQDCIQYAMGRELQRDKGI